MTTRSLSWLCLLLTGSLAEACTIVEDAAQEDPGAKADTLAMIQAHVANCREFIGQRQVYLCDVKAQGLPAYVGSQVFVMASLDDKATGLLFTEPSRSEKLMSWLGIDGHAHARLPFRAVSIMPALPEDLSGALREKDVRSVTVLVQGYVPQASAQKAVDGSPAAGPKCRGAEGCKVRLARSKLLDNAGNTGDFTIVARPGEDPKNGLYSGAEVYALSAPQRPLVIEGRGGAALQPLTRPLVPVGGAGVGAAGAAGVSATGVSATGIGAVLMIAGLTVYEEFRRKHASLPFEPVYAPAILAGEPGERSPYYDPTANDLFEAQVKDGLNNEESLLEPPSKGFNPDGDDDDDKCMKGAQAVLSYCDIYLRAQLGSFLHNAMLDTGYARQLKNNDLDNQRNRSCQSLAGAFFKGCNLWPKHPQRCFVGANTCLSHEASSRSTWSTAFDAPLFQSFYESLVLVTGGVTDSLANWLEQVVKHQAKEASIIRQQACVMGRTACLE